MNPSVLKPGMIVKAKYSWASRGFYFRIREITDEWIKGERVSKDGESKHRCVILATDVLSIVKEVSQR